MVKLNQNGNFLKVEAVHDGDLVTFKNEGEWIENTRYTYEDGTPRQDFIIKVEYKAMDYSLKLNKFSRDEIIPVYGNDTALWVGKQAKIGIENYRSLNKKGIILTPVNYEKKEVEKPQEAAWDE